MLRSFESIKGCGIFENYTWDTAVSDFERINLIYGTNGSGKTSLARALDDLSPNGSGTGSEKVSIRMSDENKQNERTNNGHHDPEFDRIFVFSDNYVNRSHDFDGDTEIEAVLTLGKRTVDEDKRILELKELIGPAEKKLSKATTDAAEAAKALDEEYKSIAKGIVTALSRAGGKYASNTKYTKAQARNKFKGSHDDWQSLSEPEKRAALSTVNSDERSRVSSKTYSYTVRENLVKDVSEALALSPVSVVLDTLRSHEEATSWVERGRHLHVGLDQCIFCSGPLSSERKRQIEGHFSKEVEEAQRAVDDLIEEVRTARKTVDNLLGDVTVPDVLFEDLRADFKTAYESARTDVAEVDSWLARLLEALEVKRANVVSFVALDISDAPAIDGTALNAAIKQHNDRVARHKSLVQEAANKVELHLLKEAEEKVANLDQAATNAADRETELKSTLDAYRSELNELNNVEGDPLPSANVMARELTRILGRGELAFELLPDGKHYRVTRHGQPARDLSTGERSALALIHFLESVKRAANADNEKPIVVIDDPVSSLDSNSATGISTYIWGEVVTKHHVEQVFLLTHNFELFRQWDTQIDGLPGGEHQRGPINKKGFTSNCYELIAPHCNLDGKLKRVPKFVLWPPSEDMRPKVRSSYHHAFLTVARARIDLARDPTMERKLDAQLLYPNVLRRMLETFLAFKNPATVGKFTKAMRDYGDKLEAYGYPGDANALRLHLTRFAHANSHADSPETGRVVNPDEIETVITAAFTFMNTLDSDHFSGICSVIGVEQDDILLERPSAAASTTS